jgi:AbrB family looped-hinge helix DNA binding protein
MTSITKISSNYQISIPKSVRDAQHWEAGQELAFIPKGVGVLLMPLPKPAQLAGLAKGAKTTSYRDIKDRF